MILTLAYNGLTFTNEWVKYNKISEVISKVSDKLGFFLNFESWNYREIFKINL